MIESLTWMTPLVVLAIVALFGFVGCVGDDAIAQAQDEGKKEGSAAAQAAVQATQQAAKYQNVVLVDPNLISYWRLSEGETGTSVSPDSAPDTPKDGQYKNAGGGGVSRSAPGALSIIAEPSDKAAEFDGVQGFMEVPYDGILNSPLEFSVELWVRPAGDLSVPQVVAASYEVDASGSVLTGFVLDVVGPDPQIRVRIGNGTPGGSGFTALQATLGDGLEYDGWRHVVVTYSAVDKSLKIYVNCIDGSPRKSLTPPADPPVYFLANRSAPFRVAAGWSERTEAAPTIGHFFKGRVDEVALYRAALDGSAVKNHFLRGTSLPT